MCAFLKHTFMLVFLFEPAVWAMRNACRPRDTCVKLTDCQPYVNLVGSLRRPLSSAAVVFLRSQECGFDGSVPLVCCFSDRSPKPQVTRNNLSSGNEHVRAMARPEFYKTSDEQSWTTTSTTKKTNHIWVLQDLTTTHSELKGKMEAINEAFALSSMMDDFFFRRMLDDKKRTR